MTKTIAVILALAFVLSYNTLSAAESVTIENFVRAETDHMVRVAMKAQKLEVGKILHARDPRTAKNSNVIRENQDTFYSSLILDLSKPVSITLPESDGRYMSMHVVSQDHYMFVESKPGSYELTKEKVGTRFASVIFRTFVDMNDPDDIAEAHRAQDGIQIDGGGKGPFEAPEWDADNLEVIRKALNDVAALGFDTTYAFGTKEETRPIDHLIGTASGWGGLPRKAALYLIESVEKNDGKTPYSVTVKDVPVDAFWSITVYNADGYLEANEAGRNSYNNITAKPNEDGSFTINFGGPSKAINNLPITKGWSYVVRLYQPLKEILDGSWRFPAITQIKE